MSELVGRLTVIPSEECEAHKRVTWRIDLGVNRERIGRPDAVASGWGYLSRNSAILAAKRWAKRLDIKLVCDAHFHCPECDRIIESQCKCTR